MRQPAFPTFLATIFVLAGVPARGSTDTARGFDATIATSASCVDTTVHSVEPRLTSGAPNERYTHQEIVDSGPAVTFNTKLGQPNGVMWAEVVHYGGEPGNDVMIAERPGDRVRVCFLGAPKRDEACNPSTDLRGRKFKVYDYRQKATYSGINSEHDCGGA